MAIRFDNIEAINLLNNQGEQTIALTNDQGVIVSGNVAMATGNATGKFAVKSAGVHASYDFYNDGTSYFNGGVTVDAGLSQTGGADVTFSGDVYIPEYIYHSGDTNTYIRFTADTQTFRTGGNDRLILTNTGVSISGGLSVSADTVLGNGLTDTAVVHGHLGIGEDGYPKIAYPGKKAQWSGSGSTTGQIVIDLPGTLGNYDMMYMEIDIYNYSAEGATKLIIGGHNWNSGGNSNTSSRQWYNVNVQVIGALDKPIYFGRRNDGTSERRCIAIGETDSTWSYGTVHVSKVSGASGFYTSGIDWVGDWNVDQTTEDEYFTKNPSTNFNSGTTLETNGNISASNFSGSSSGTNTGDQTLPTLSSLGALSTSAAASTYLPLAGGTMTGTLVAPRVSLTLDTGNNVNSRVTVYESGATSYGMMLWNDNATSGDWATMIYGPNQDNRKISFGKANSNFPGTKASVDELAYVDLDNGNFVATGTLSGTNFSGSSSGTNTGDQTNISGNAATATTAAKLTDGGGISTHPGTSNLIYTGALGSSVTGLFAASDNSNSILTVNRHSGDYNSQLGFSSNGNLYYRKFSNSTAYTTQGWNTIAFTNNASMLNSNVTLATLGAQAAGSYAAAAHNHDDRYYTETEINTKYTTTDGSGDEWKFTLGDESSLTGNKWYKVAWVNTGSGGLHIKGSISNHVESFGTQKVDLLLQGREGDDGDEIEITGTVDVLHNATGTSTDKAGIRVIKSAVGTYYDTYMIYIRTTRYSQAKFHLTKFGTTGFDTSKPSVTSEPAPVSGGNVELDTSTLTEGHYVIVDSAVKLSVGSDITLNGFGAGYLKTNVNGVISNTATIPWSTVSGTPTTISGYGITDALAIGTTSTTAMAGNTTIPSGNAVIDWTADQGNTNIHSGNYSNTQLSQQEVADMLTAGANITITTDGEISATDTDTVYTHPTTAGNKHIPAGGAAGEFLRYSSDGTAVWATPSYTTNTNTTYSAGAGLDLTGTTFSVEPDLRDGITYVGKDTSNFIEFDSSEETITFIVGGNAVAVMQSDGDLHIKGDVIAFSGIFNP